jgi:DNA-binding CsgD family transcriptional regulator
MTATRHLTTLRAAAFSLAAALTCGLAAAAGPATATTADVQARYEQERARCLAGQSGQVMGACMKEAVNARDAAMKGQLSDGNGQLRKNAKERCDVLTGTEQEILQWAAQGYLIDEIAQQWQASVHSVACGIRRVYHKLQFDRQASRLSLRAA